MGERKLSWREIDRLRDKGGFARIRQKREKEQPQNPEEKRRYLKALNELFKSKEEKEKEEAEKNLFKAYNTSRFKREVKSFIEKYGVPEKIDTLLMCLETKDKEIVKKCLKKLEELSSCFDEKEKEKIKSRLKVFLFSLDELLALEIQKFLKKLG